MELMPMHIKLDLDCTRDEPAPADPAAAPVPTAATCFGILADGKTACTSKKTGTKGRFIRLLQLESLQLMTFRVFISRKIFD